MLERMAETALVVLVPAAEALVATPRRHHDPAAAVGVPAHVTVLYPFRPDVDGDTDAVVAALAASVPSFEVTFATVARFPGGVVYLAPDPGRTVPPAHDGRRRCVPRLAAVRRRLRGRGPAPHGRRRDRRAHGRRRRGIDPARPPGRRPGRPALPARPGRRRALAASSATGRSGEHVEQAAPGAAQAAATGAQAEIAGDVRARHELLVGGVAESVLEIPLMYPVVPYAMRSEVTWTPYVSSFLGLRDARVAAG